MSSGRHTIMPSPQPSYLSTPQETGMKDLMNANGYGKRYNSQYAPPQEIPSHDYYKNTNRPQVSGAEFGIPDYSSSFAPESAYSQPISSLGPVEEVTSITTPRESPPKTTQAQTRTMHRTYPSPGSAPPPAQKVLEQIEEEVATLLPTLAEEVPPAVQKPSPQKVEVKPPVQPPKKAPAKEPAAPPKQVPQTSPQEGPFLHATTTNGSSASSGAITNGIAALSLPPIMVPTNQIGYFLGSWKSQFQILAVDPQQALKAGHVMRLIRSTTDRCSFLVTGERADAEKFYKELAIRNLPGKTPELIYVDCASPISICILEGSMRLECGGEFIPLPGMRRVEIQEGLLILH